MDTLEKSIALNQLYDLYQELLTTKQREYFEQYYFDDFSITEISENFEVSRNAVHDLIKRTVAKLHDLEQKLHLLQQQKSRQQIVEQIQQQNQDETVAKLLEELIKVE